ncbi:MAG: alpha/beta fold hydrolase, partial [Pacificimonas sp.]
PSPLPAADVVAHDGAARLLRHGAEGPAVILVPSLVNPPSILDLDADRSLVRWLAARGFAAHLVDWGRPGARESGYDLADYVRQLERLIAATQDAMLVGYCLGGTLAMAAAARGHARALVTIAAPWNFDGYPDARRKELAAYWQRVAAVAKSVGAVPMSMIQPAFWSLDPAAPVAKYEHYATLGPDSTEARRFEAIEDWANGGAPVTLPAMRDALERFFGENITGRHAWTVAGHSVRPQDVAVPWFNIVSTTDRIVPAAAAPPSPQDLHVAAGHVGMVIGGRAKALLGEPLADWLRSH